MASDVVKIVVHPLGTDADSLTVPDAMQQVLDYFILLAKAEARDPTDDLHVVWRLEKASTNSPLTIEAVGMSSRPDVSLGRQATQASMAFAGGLSKLVNAEAKEEWIDDEALKIIERILVRSQRSVGRTEFYANGDPPVILDSRGSVRAENFIRLWEAKEAAKAEDLSRREYGGVEGEVVSVITYFNKPAVLLRERLSRREIKCVLPPGTAHTIGSEHDWNEAWSNRRFLVSGVCHYDRQGNLTRVDAEEIQALQSTNVDVRDVRDPKLTNGLSVQEHLERIWGREDG